MSEISPDQRPLLQQAPVVPLDASAFTASIIGTTLFGAATVIWIWGDLGGIWLYVVATGTAIGLILIPFTALHRYRRIRNERIQTALEESLKELRTSHSVED
ncbi:MAG: hypothetical protein FWD55_04910 [Propionibacteriaceae bacterium]|nr:hypothetical protein [Propionibacteriaceae bacterium]